MLWHRSPRPSSKAWKPGLARARVCAGVIADRMNVGRHRPWPSSARLFLSSVVGLCVTGGPVCGRGRGDSDVKRLGVYEKRIGNKWAVVGLRVVLAGWPGRGGRRRWSSWSARNRRAWARHMALDLSNVPTELVSPTGRPTSALACARNLADTCTSPPRISLRRWVRIFSLPPTESRWRALRVWSSSTRAQHAPGTARWAGPTMCQA